jgi:hypothetical protein
MKIRTLELTLTVIYLGSFLYSDQAYASQTKSSVEGQQQAFVSKNITDRPSGYHSEPNPQEIVQPLKKPLLKEKVINTPQFKAIKSAQAQQRAEEARAAEAEEAKKAPTSPSPAAAPAQKTQLPAIRTPSPSTPPTNVRPAPGSLLGKKSDAPAAATSKPKGNSPNIGEKASLKATNEAKFQKLEVWAKMIVDMTTGTVKKGFLKKTEIDLGPLQANVKAKYEEARGSCSNEHLVASPFCTNDLKALEISIIAFNSILPPSGKIKEIPSKPSK